MIIKIGPLEAANLVRETALGLTMESSDMTINTMINIIAHLDLAAAHIEKAQSRLHDKINVDNKDGKWTDKGLTYA